MALNPKLFHGKKVIARDIRPLYVRLAEKWQKPTNALATCILGIGLLLFFPKSIYYADIILILFGLFLWWLRTRSRALPVKMPIGAPYSDTNDMSAGRDGTPGGIFYVGNSKRENQQIWFNNSDTRTHILYLGTTGSGKTEGLKSFVTSAMSWGSGFVYIDGKADTDLWSSLSSLVRRFGRDDDLLVLNYMTGNSDARAPSNTMNPFSSGSSSYLTQMLVSLMPEAEGDNAMWKERAVSLMSSLMPALTWKRDNQDFSLSVSTIRNYLNLNYVIKLSRDEAIPAKIREGIIGYLDTLPGYVDGAFDDEGKEKPMGPDQPMVDTTTVRQQHGYLTMQFTRALQSLGDDYGYIFDTKAADIDMVDIVLNRRVLVTLIPALEKSGDETANLGKIVAASIKGMMGSTLGSTLEGDVGSIIENKPTQSSTPFMVVFDEVGYYTAQGMAVMAAQARSLGFCLCFSAQDLQAMEKRVKEEARSIAANCNIKIFGKLQDPTQTREYFENHVGNAYFAQVSSYENPAGGLGSFGDTKAASIHKASRADYDDLKEMTEGEAIIAFGIDVIPCNIFYSNPGFAKAMRVSRYLALPEPDEAFIKHASSITKLRDALFDKQWTATKADVAMDVPKEIEFIKAGYKLGADNYDDPIDHGIIGLCALHADMHPVEAQEAIRALSQPEEEPAPSLEEIKAPIKYDDLAKEETPKPVQAMKNKLNADVQKILSKAGKDLRNKLLRSGKGSDIDAAE